MTTQSDSDITIRRILTLIPTSWIGLLLLYTLAASFSSKSELGVFAADPKTLDFYFVLPLLMISAPVVLLAIITNIYVQFATFKARDKKSILSVVLFIFSSLAFIWLAFFYGVLDWIAD